MYCTDCTDPELVALANLSISHLQYEIGEDWSALVGVSIILVFSMSMILEHVIGSLERE